MEQYCKSHKNLYYVDVTKGMRDATGGLKRIYASDGYVHISMAGYELWTNNLVEYVEKLLAQEKTATRMVEIVKHTKRKKDYNRACEYVSGLEKSTTKTQLTNRLKRLKKRLY